MDYLKLVIINHQNHGEPQIIDGTYRHVEELLRHFFPEETQLVRPGDLYNVLREVARSYAIEVSILAGRPPQPAPHLNPEPVRQ